MAQKFSAVCRGNDVVVSIEADNRLDLLDEAIGSKVLEFLRENGYDDFIVADSSIVTLDKNGNVVRVPDYDEKVTYRRDIICVRRNLLR